MSKEEIINRLEEIKYQTEELEAERIELSSILMEKMLAKEELIDDFIVKKITTVRYNPPEEWAREAGVLITKEVVDSKAVKALAKAGIEVPGKTEVTYLKWGRE